MNPNMFVNPNNGGIIMNQSKTTKNNSNYYPIEAGHLNINMKNSSSGNTVTNNVSGQ